MNTLLCVILALIVSFVLARIVIIRAVKQIDRSEKNFASVRYKYQWILENINDIYFELSLDATIINLSPSFEKVTNFKTANVIGNSLNNYYQDKEYGTVIFKLIQEKGELINHEIKLQDKDGNVLDCTFTATLMRDSSNKPIKICGIMHDISEQKKSQQLIQESELRYKTLVDLSPNPIFVIQDKKIVFGNPATLDLVRCINIEKLKRTAPVKFIYKEDRVHFFEYLKQIELKKQYIPTELRIVSFKNEVIHVLSHARIIIYNDKPAYLFVMQEISKIKHYENELLKSKAKAEESDKLKSSFLANMSHEIRTPLNGIIGFASLIRKPNIAPEKLDSYTQIIQSASHQLLALINDIIDISKIEAGQMVVNNAPLNINILMDEMYALFKGQAERKNLSFQMYKSHSDKEAMMISDEMKIKQILNNLLNNAIKFTEEGKIEFGYLIKYDSIEFRVKDSGIGIPEQYKNIVFERFRQVEASDNRRFGGTGLGLSITKALTEIMGGAVTIESNKPQGSVFTIQLPYKPIERELKTNIPSDNTKQAIPNWKGKTILIAEDEETNYFYLEEIINDTGANILYAENGLEAIDLFENHPEIDLALLDIKMPEMDGFQVLKIIKDKQPTLPVLAQTAYAMSNEKIKVFESGFTNYISKPIDRILFYRLLDQYLSVPF